MRVYEPEMIVMGTRSMRMQVHECLIEGDVRAGELQQGRSLTEETQEFPRLAKGEAHGNGGEQQTINHSQTPAG